MTCTQSYFGATLECYLRTCHEATLVCDLHCVFGYWPRKRSNGSQVTAKLWILPPTARHSSSRNYNYDWFVPTPDRHQRGAASHWVGDLFSFSCLNYRHLAVSHQRHLCWSKHWSKHSANWKSLSGIKSFHFEKWVKKQPSNRTLILAEEWEIELWRPVSGFPISCSFHSLIKLPILFQIYLIF